MTKKIFLAGERAALFGALFGFIMIVYLLIKYHSLNESLMTDAEVSLLTMFKYIFLIGIFLVAYVAKRIITELSERLKKAKEDNLSINKANECYIEILGDRNKENFTLRLCIDKSNVEASMLNIQLKQAIDLKQNMKEIAVRWQEKQRDEKAKADYLEAALKMEQGRTDQIIDKLLKEIVGGLNVTHGDIVLQPGKMSKKARRKMENFLKDENE